MSLDSIIAWFTIAHLTELSVAASALANVIPSNTLIWKLLNLVGVNLHVLTDKLPGSAK